jgi:2,4-dienoyl-CoA reductase-like NADH-dependent reductase (Old Yellow Enzyme family)
VEYSLRPAIPRQRVSEQNNNNVGSTKNREKLVVEVLEEVAEASPIRSRISLFLLEKKPLTPPAHI